MDEEREEGNRKRTRRDPDQVNDTAMTGQEEEQSTLWAAEEALKEALRNSRGVYSTVTSSLQAAIVSGSGSSAGEGEMDEGVSGSGMGAAVTACSLLRRTLRVFHGTERHLAHQHQVPGAVVVSAGMDKVQVFLQQLSTEAGIDTSRWAAQIAARE